MTGYRGRRPSDAGDLGTDAELRFHLETRAAGLVRTGMTPDEARAQAMREFGDLDRARRDLSDLDRRLESRHLRRQHMSEFRRDMVLAWRTLRAAPAFSVTAVATLALGIGATTAIFSLVNGVLLRPLPFPEPDRLYAVYSVNRTASMFRASVSAVDLDDWRARRALIDDLGGYWYGEGASGVTLTGRGAPARLSAVFVEPGFFSTLRATPHIGRVPRADELVRGGPTRVVVFGHAFWRREFAGHADVVGSTVSFDGTPYTVIGVLPETFQFPAPNIDVYLPFATIPDDGIPRIRPVRILRAVARTKPGVTLEQARAELSGIAARIAEAEPDNRAWDAADLVSLSDVVVGPARQGLVVLFGGVCLVLLVAVVNLAGLQLARTMERGRDVAVRLALGASRGRLVRQLLTESLLLAAVGGAVGVVLGRTLLAGLLGLAEGQLPRATEVSLDGAAVAFAVVLSTVTGVLFGLAPAWHASRSSLQQVARDPGRGLSGRSPRVFRSALVVAEVALSVVLAVGAGLVGRSYLALIDTPPGFRPDGLLAVQFTIDSARHTPPGEAEAAPGPGLGAPFTRYYTEVIEAVRRVPGVVDAAAVKDSPFGGVGERVGFRIPGRVVPAGQDPPSAALMHVSDGYFRTLGSRVDGREFTPDDRSGAPFVFVVNEAFVRQYFPGARGVGERLRLGRLDVEIVGVVEDIRQSALAEPPVPTIYAHNLQNSRVKTTLLVRADGDPTALADDIRRTIWGIDPLQAITAVFTMDDAVGQSVARPRLLVVLLGAFGLAAVLLGAVGLYGIVRSLVGERRREMGLRLALGATPRSLSLMMVRRGLRLAAAGTAAGMVVAWSATGWLQAVLYGVEPTDVVTFVLMACLLLVTAGLASWLPARRAGQVDPIQTLRD